MTLCYQFMSSTRHMKFRQIDKLSAVSSESNWENFEFDGKMALLEQDDEIPLNRQVWSTDRKVKEINDENP